MQVKVIVPTMADALTDHYLIKRGYDVITTDNPGADDILRLAPDAAAIMMVNKPVPNQLYDQMPNLQVLARKGVGYDSIDVNFAARKGVWVTNTPGANARAVAESALMDILLLARRIPVMQARMRKGGWAAGHDVLGHEVGGSTVGIVGFGHIGQMLARMLHELGAHVLIYNRHPRETDYGTFVDWDELFSRSNYVSVHLAAVPDTIHSIGAREFQMMPQGAVLVNLARGSIIDEPAMIDALQSGTLAAAALDVFDQEPLPADNPLWNMDNVFMTPHVGANTYEANRAMAMTAAQMIDQALTGRTPEFAVNKPVRKHEN